MACRGCFYALTQPQVAELFAAADPASYLQSLYERLEEERIVSVDKSWDAMHRCLCGGWLDAVHGEVPLRSCVIGGRQLTSKSGNYIISFVSADEVPAVASATHAITKEWFRSAYFNLPSSPPGPRWIFAVFKPKPFRYDNPISEQDFEYTWSYFEEVRAFYERAATAACAVVFLVDQ